MKTNYVKEEMQVLIESMNEQFEMMQEHELHIPQIEIDIFMRNIQKLYESTIYLNKLNAKDEVKTTASTNMVEEKVSVIADEIMVEKQAAMIEETAEESVQILNQNEEKSVQITEAAKEHVMLEKEVEESVEHSTASKTIKTVDAEKEDLLIMNHQNTQTTAQKAEVKITDQLFAFDDLLEDKKEETDLFSSVKTTNEISDLNKKLAEARNTQSIVEKLQTKRIDSLKSVIGINDKFYFINELFAGDTQKYEAIIYTLNNFKKLEDAMVYFSTLKYKFGWDEEAEAYIKLTQMLERKFEMEHA